MMVGPRGEGDLGSGGNLPHGAAPSLDGTSGGTPGEPQFTSPNLNPDGDWIRLEEKTADGYSFSIFLNRFRVRRAPSRDETVRKEVRRSNRRTREVGGGMCVTEEDVTYENRLRRAYILDQAYDYYIVDGWLEWWYGIFNHDGSTLGSMFAGTAGAEVAGGLTAGSGVVAGSAATVGMTIGGALLVGGATFVSVTQGMSEWKEASEKHHSGWMPIMWYFERDSLPDDPDPLTVTELVAMHPCGRPVTGSIEPEGTGFIFSATPVVDGAEPSAPSDAGGAEPEDELPGLPTEEGDVEATPDAEVAADEVPEADVPLMSKPEFEGSGENLSSPDFAPENDWYRDLGERAGYHFVVQYVNRYREVADPRFDSRSEEAVPTGRQPRTRRSEEGVCQDEVEHDLVTYTKTGTRVDQQFQIWRVDSAEAAEQLKKALREKTSGQSYTTPSGIGSNTASTASGHVATSAEVTGGLIDFPGSVADAASETAGSVAGVVGSVAGWAGNIIDILGLEEPPVPAGAGWTPIGHYLSTAEEVAETPRRDWLPVGDPYPCPDEASGSEAGVVSAPSYAAPTGSTGIIQADGGEDHAESAQVMEPATKRFSSAKLIKMTLAVFGSAAVVYGGYVFATGGDDPEEAESASQNQSSSEGSEAGEDPAPPSEDEAAAGTEFGIDAVSVGLPAALPIAELADERRSGDLAPTGEPLAGSGPVSDVLFDAVGDELRFEVSLDRPIEPWFLTFTISDGDSVVLETSVIDSGDSDPVADLVLFGGDAAGGGTDASAPRFVAQPLDMEVVEGLIAIDVPRGLRGPRGLPINRGGQFDLFVTLGSSGGDVPTITRYPAGRVELPPGLFVEDESLTTFTFQEGRRQGLAGAPQAVADCILETVTYGDEMLSFLDGTLGNLVVPCYFSASPVGEMAAAGLAGFAADERAAISCIGNQLGLRAVPTEDVAALALPWEEWPPGLLDTYAGALEVCVPLEPFYLARFSAFEYTRGGCPEAMTAYVLERYSWKRFIEEGIIDPVAAVRDAARVRFESDVTAGYGLNECFQA